MTVMVVHGYLPDDGAKGGNTSEEAAQSRPGHSAALNRALLVIVADAVVADGATSAAASANVSKSGAASSVQSPCRQPDDNHESIQDDDGVDAVKEVGSMNLFGDEDVGDNGPGEDGLASVLVWGVGR